MDMMSLGSLKYSLFDSSGMGLWDIEGFDFLIRWRRLGNSFMFKFQRLIPPKVTWSLSHFRDIVT